MRRGDETRDRRQAGDETGQRRRQEKRGKTEENVRGGDCEESGEDVRVEKR